MRAIVIAGGEAPSKATARSIIQAGDFLIAADSGLETLKSYGLEPDLVAGDMDSTDEGSLSGVPAGRILRFPRAKDESDAELCVRLAWERGFDHTALLGGGGGRIDHFAALLLLFERLKAPEAWYLPQEQAFRIDERLSFRAERGTRVSLIPLGAEPLRMRSEGLAWPLDGLEFPRGFMSLSNEATGGVAAIEVIAGRALLSIPYGVELR